MNVEVLEIRRGRKFDQVLAGARKIFLRDGYEGASVDQIARAAGVSKATLYSYFPDKAVLFMEVARLECQFQSERAMSKFPKNGAPNEVLEMAADHMTRFMLSDFGQQMFRTMVAESTRFPDIGREFYETVAVAGREQLISYLRCASDRGELAIEDFTLAAEQFKSLCMADLHTKFMFGVKKQFEDSEIKHVVSEAVQTFLARYGK